MIAVVDYDTGNLRSVADALRRIGAGFTLTADPAQLLQAERVILPGVGEAASAMAKLRERGLDEVIPRLEVPVLGVCIGMQLLCQWSEEGDTACLGIFSARVGRIPATTREGARLKEDILSRAAAIEEKVALVEARSPQTVAEYRSKLEARMNEVLSNTQLDPARILTEAAIFADKVAVDEETVRLRSHIDQLREMLSKGGATGRKLDFLIQEFNREANTIGSKCGDIDIARQVVDIKAEIEKIREQVQNIE